MQVIDSTRRPIFHQLSGTIFYAATTRVQIDWASEISIYHRNATWLFEVVQMADEKKGKAEETAEKTGELLGKGLKKGFGIAKALGKGTKDAVEKKKE